MTIATIARYRRVVGVERDAVAAQIVPRYERGESIRRIAVSIGRSYGFVHRLLLESGVLLRRRGGVLGSTRRTA